MTSIVLKNPLSDRKDDKENNKEDDQEDENLVRKEQLVVEHRIRCGSRRRLIGYHLISSIRYTIRYSVSCSIKAFDRDEFDKHLRLQMRQIDKNMSSYSKVCLDMTPTQTCSRPKHLAAQEAPKDIKELMLLCAKMTSCETAILFVMYISMKCAVRFTSTEADQFVTDALWSNIVHLFVIKKRNLRRKKAYDKVLELIQPNIAERVERIVTKVTKYHSTVWQGNFDLLRELVKLECQYDIRQAERSNRDFGLISRSSRSLRLNIKRINFTEKPDEAAKQLRLLISWNHGLQRRVLADELFPGMLSNGPRESKELKKFYHGLVREPTARHVDRIKQRILDGDIPKARTYPFSDCIVWEAMAKHFPEDIHRLRQVLIRME